MKKYLTVKEVSHRYGIGVSTVWQWVKDGLLPSPIKFGQRSTRWDCDSLDEHDSKIKTVA
ncbi:MAG: helix-turn-helix domain-containing protein [Candidatus Thiodiazotropha taylori]|jgi:excisionase family DNA binding protein|nr:helix-turn-helix domain-containing protein [Candidatus Thiodiazotropha taylori]MCG7932629.1 helix-turn-helix domain-containing protein [Candidatus Thiodiazotropha lotti]MCW4222480.1 helix-turn-helix domain-containing protein [Candidatus Thiodiazotropha lotti]